MTEAQECTTCQKEKCIGQTGGVCSVPFGVEIASQCHGHQPPAPPADAQPGESELTAVESTKDILQSQPMPESVATSFFAALFKGKHHIPCNLKPFGFGWAVSYYGDLSTWDSNMLTRLVFLAHDACIRAEIGSSSPRMVRIIIHQRATREGGFAQRHPTIESALANWRATHPDGWRIEA